MKIIVPAYNPNEHIIDLVNEIKKIINCDIIVIDDGSKEEYKYVFEDLKKSSVIILTHKTNQGKGQALKTGIKYIKDIGEKEGCICADSDGQHTPEDIFRVAEELKKSKKDVVLGTRDFLIDSVPLRSKFGNIISCFLFYAMTGEKITDTQTGLRGYSAKIFDWLISVKGNRYEYEFNILLGLKDYNISYKEIKIKTIYEDKNKESHFRPIQDSILIYKPVFKFIISSISAFIIDFSLLLLFKYLLGKLFISVVFSRAISSIFNFVINKKIVFEYNGKNKTIEVAMRYYSLVIIIMLLNYFSIKALTELLGFSLVIAKILTEIVLYSLSFIVQKRIVFSKKG